MKNQVNALMQYAIRPIPGAQGSGPDKLFGPDAARNAVRRTGRIPPRKHSYYFFDPKGMFRGYYPDFDTAYATALLMYDYAEKEQRQ